MTEKQTDLQQSKATAGKMIDNDDYKIKDANDTTLLTSKLDEKWWHITIQFTFLLLITGIGAIGTGIILGHVESWKVFKVIPELFILVPALLGVKGNLDTTLASRLSTQANLGNLSSYKEIAQQVLGNIALVQVQATVAAFIVSFLTMGIGSAVSLSIKGDHLLLLITASILTTTSSCLILGFFLSGVIVLANSWKLNPDNLATPLAASISDAVAISLFILIIDMLFQIIYTHLWITYVVIVIYILLLPMWILIVLRNKYVRPVLKSGWIPVLSALFISGLGGLVLMTAVDRFTGFVVFQPIINGIGGNLVSVQASKMATMLHQCSYPGILPPHGKIFELPWRSLFHGTPYAKTARILISISIPGQILFIFLADFIHQSRLTIGVAFVFSYLTASLIQILLLLYMAHVMIHAMWHFKIDPDSAAIPYLTALGDFLGSVLLFATFEFLK